MPQFAVPPLRWPSNALAPIISAETIATHHDFHHRAYIDKTNKLTEGTRFQEMSLEEVVTEAARSKETETLAKNAGQAWNHARYWESLSPKPGEPSDGLAEQIERDFRSMAHFREKFIKLGTAHFASGWVWLTFAGGKLHVLTTHDADSPLLLGHDTLLAIDLWEHAYYLDYTHERERHLRAVVEGALDWAAASDKFDAAAR